MIDERNRSHVAAARDWVSSYAREGPEVACARGPVHCTVCLCRAYNEIGLPAEFDNNQAELDGLILALRRHVALLAGISVHEVLRRLLHDCEYAIGPAADADDDGETVANARRGGKGMSVDASAEARDLLVIIDSEIIANLFDRAWRKGDIKWLRGETYGLRTEEALLLRSA